MKKFKLVLCLLSTTTFAVVDYDQYDSSEDVAEADTRAPAPVATGKTVAPLTQASSASIGFPSIEYSSVKVDGRDGVEVLLPTGGKDIPTAISKWNFGMRFQPQEDLDLQIGVPILDSSDFAGSRTEVGNPTLDIATVWFQGKSPQPVKVDFLAHASFPHRGKSAYFAHNRWDVGPGIGTSKRFGRAMVRLQGIYVFKKSATGSAYQVGDMLWAKGALALSITPEIDFQVVGDFKRAYKLKQDNKVVVNQANLNTISPQMVIHMNNTVDLMLGGTFVSNRGAYVGKEAAFGDISYDGLMGDQVTLGLGIEI